MQNPNFFGRVHNFKEAFAQGLLAILCCNPISAGVLRTPAEMGADIAVGEEQPLGLPLSFGGLYLGFMAVSEALLRLMPGRVVGRTVDGQGRPGCCLTLQTREQHIHREKATSKYLYQPGPVRGGQGRPQGAGPA